MLCQAFWSVTPRPRTLLTRCQLRRTSSRSTGGACIPLSPRAYQSGNSSHGGLHPKQNPPWTSGCRSNGSTAFRTRSAQRRLSQTSPVRVNTGAFKTRPASARVAQQAAGPRAAASAGCTWFSSESTIIWLTWASIIFFIAWISSGLLLSKRLECASSPCAIIAAWSSSAVLSPRTSHTLRKPVSFISLSYCGSRSIPASHCSPCRRHACSRATLLTVHFTSSTPRP